MWQRLESKGHFKAFRAPYASYDTMKAMHDISYHVTRLSSDYHTGKTVLVVVKCLFHGHLHSC
jgi:hypothetical protein